ncbi:SPOSA6832_02503 [Sporobolomyces salmonicolor]|uniref:SPOSA6832_02503-mRNA-1:cds n=1 Tax=Sporidiobolus salmonicolor TaxID=5005 RepID=A0A0D6ELJ4_SPOSA|nr:SPOSA6832_02503 [Sporobolomyces salmonicolor]
MAQQFIGSLISLISKSDVRAPRLLSPLMRQLTITLGPSACTGSLFNGLQIRYQGVLHSIDPQAATVSLEKGAQLLSSLGQATRGCRRAGEPSAGSRCERAPFGSLWTRAAVLLTCSLPNAVRSLGTEGRKANPAEEVPASENVYDFIVFRASDVKDLQIEAPASASAAEPAVSDPAIVGTFTPGSDAPASSAPAPQPSSPPKPSEPSQHPQTLQHAPQSPFQMPPPHLGHPAPFGPYPPFASPFGGPPPPFPPYGAPYPPFGAPGPFGPPGGPVPPWGAAAPAAADEQPQQPPSHVALSPNVAPAASAAGLAVAQTPAAAPATPNETRPAANGTDNSKSPAVAPAPTSSSTEPKPVAPSPKKQPSDVEQLAKDMSRAHLASGGPTTSSRQRRGEDGVGASIFSGPTQTSPSQNRPGRPLQPFGGPGQGAKQSVPLPEADFDFASANAAFQKPSALPGTPTGSITPSSAPIPASGAGAADEDEFVVPPPTESYYNPSKSFFDSISSDAKTRADPSALSAAGRHGGTGGGYGGGRYDREREREKNMEAFGESGAGLGRGGYRRGGRGRRGGGGGAGYNVGGQRYGGQRQQQQQQ